MANRVIQNQSSATHRKNPINKELEGILQEVGEANDVFFEIFSGSQTGDGASRPPHAGPAHNHGQAADLKIFVMEDGNKRFLSMTNEADQPLLAKVVGMGRSLGLNGLGAGPNYMGAESFHLDVYGDNFRTWGTEQNKAGQWVTGDAFGPLEAAFAKGVPVPPLDLLDDLRPPIPAPRSMGEDVRAGRPVTFSHVGSGASFDEVRGFGTQLPRPRPPATLPPGLRPSQGGAWGLDGPVSGVTDIGAGTNRDELLAFRPGGIDSEIERRRAQLDELRKKAGAPVTEIGRGTNLDELRAFTPLAAPGAGLTQEQLKAIRAVNPNTPIPIPDPMVADVPRPPIPPIGMGGTPGTPPATSPVGPVAPALRTTAPGTGISQEALQAIRAVPTAPAPPRPPMGSPASLPFVPVRRPPTSLPFNPTAPSPSAPRPPATTSPLSAPGAGLTAAQRLAISGSGAPTPATRSPTFPMRLDPGNTLEEVIPETDAERFWRENQPSSPAPLHPDLVRRNPLNPPPPRPRPEPSSSSSGGSSSRPPSSLPVAPPPRMPTALPIAPPPPRAPALPPAPSVPEWITIPNPALRANPAQTVTTPTGAPIRLDQMAAIRGLPPGSFAPPPPPPPAIPPTITIRSPARLKKPVITALPIAPPVPVRPPPVVPRINSFELTQMRNAAEEQAARDRGSTITSDTHRVNARYG